VTSEQINHLGPTADPLILKVVRGYEFKTDPLGHQLREWKEHGQDTFRAIFWEQGTGKSKLIIDSMAELYEMGEINGLLVVAPNGVHTNWVSDEIPKHLPDRIRQQTRTHIYRAKSASAKYHIRGVEALYDHEGLSILVISYDAFVTMMGKKQCKKFLQKREAFYVLDESTRIKSVKAKRSRTIVSSGPYGKYRRILTGTPITNGPFDIYMQFRFLDADFWKPRELHPYAVFKSFFGIFQTVRLSDTKTFEQLVRFRNLEKLKELIAPFSDRVLKDEVLDLPPKLYSRRYYEMTPEQSRIYDNLRDSYMTIVNDTLITAPLAIVRMMRLQQILCGYVAEDEVDESGARPMQMIPGGNARLTCLMETLEEISHKTIIWCRFRTDIDLIMDQCKEDNIWAVRYDGKCSEEEREEALNAFREGPAQVFIATAQCAGEGLTITQARTEIYYSNTFNLKDRMQSEDRAHRIGQEHPVEIIDIACLDTIDMRITEALQRKLDVASEIVGDAYKEWLRE
jgi:SNF2 family DNA or RNA helicase